jgi:large subunit ribosomal protein L22
MEIRATQKFVITSPRKLREVAALVRDLSPKDAVERLPYVQKRAAEPLRKVIRTAIANAKQANVDVEDLSLKEIQINEGPKLKRWRAGARGRAKPYEKRMSHIRVILEAKAVKKRGTKKIKNKRTEKLRKTEGKVTKKVTSVKTQRSSLKKLKKIISRKSSKSKKGAK